MNLTSLDLYSNNVFVARFDCEPDGTSPFLLIDESGLGAETIVQRYVMESASGEPFYDLTVPSRTISLQMILNPNYEIGESIDELRSKLYKAIASSQTSLVELRFNNGGSVFAHIYGFITKFDSPRFSKTISASIEIKATTELLAPMLTTVTVNDSYAMIVDSNSNAPHGCIISCTLLNTCPEIRFTPGVSDSSVPPEETGKLYFVLTNSFMTYDILTISSMVNDKYVTLTRGGVVTHIADLIYNGSVWPTLYPGTNELVASTFIGGAEFNRCRIDTVKYYATYWGV